MNAKVTMRKSMTPGEVAYAALVATARALGLPKRFPRDLYVHDRAWLTSRNPEHFAWCVYDLGTVAFAYVPPRERYASGDQTDYRSLARTMATMGDRMHLYIWDGSALVPVDLEALTRYLVDGVLPGAQGAA